MHPALSVILFTTASGAGYGLLALCGVLAPFGLPPRGPWFAVVALGLALGLITLKPVHQWNNAHVVPAYLALALMTGALLLNALLLWGAPNAGVAILALLAIALGAWLKERYWRFVDGTTAASTPETAVGLLGRGKVRALDRPHTGQNYLLREMGFAIARKHAHKLRRTALLLGFVAPLFLTLLAALLGGPLATLASVLAVLSVAAGVLAERWLFFAEAKHTVTLYYGALEA
jgi:DMSO reductase anchor subunit